MALVLGLIRFVRLGEWSLWIDEIYTWGDAHQAGLDSHNPLGYRLIRWTVEAFGGVPTEAAMRFSPAVAGWLAIPLTAWAFRPLAGPRRAALAALFVALSAWQLQWAQTARFYTFVEVMTLLGAGIILRGVALGPAGRIRIPLIACGAVIAGASFLFHAHGVAIVVATVAGLVLAWPTGVAAHKQLPRWAVIGLLIGAVAALGLVYPAWQHYSEEKPVSDPVAGMTHYVLATVFYVTPAIGVMAALSFVVGDGLRDPRLRFAAVTTAAGLLGMMVASAVATVTAQYAFPFFPWIALLAAWPCGGQFDGAQFEGDESEGVGSGESRMKRLPLAWGTVGAVVLATQSFLYMTVEHGQRPRWRDAAKFVETEREPTDLVAALPGTPAEFYLLLESKGIREVEVRSHDYVIQIDRHDDMRLFDAAREGRTTWIMIRSDYRMSLPREIRERLDSFLAQECRRVASFPVAAAGRDLDIDVWRYGM